MNRINDDFRLTPASVCRKTNSRAKRVAIIALAYTVFLALSPVLLSGVVAGIVGCTFLAGCHGGRVALTAGLAYLVGRKI